MNIEDKIKEKYPYLLSDQVASIGCGKGWHKIVLEVCEKIKYYGAKIEQIKEKFGSLRIYVDHHNCSRILLKSVDGRKDGVKVDPNVPGAEVLIQFHDNARKPSICCYLPESDKFVDIHGKEIEVIDPEFVKGRLAQLTGLVDAEPRTEETLSEVIAWAEKEADITCEGCGTKENVTRGGDWIKVLCDKCRSKKRWYDEDED